MGQLELQISTKSAEASLKRLSESVLLVDKSLSQLGKNDAFKKLNTQAKAFKGVDGNVTKSLKGLNSELSKLGTNTGAAKAAASMKKIGAGGASIQKATGNVAKLGSAFGKTGSMIRVATGFLAGFGIALGAAGIRRFLADTLDLVNSFTRFNIIMKTVGGSQEFAGKQLEFIRRVTRETATDIRVASQAYAKFAAATMTAGFSTKDTQGVFENMSKVFRVMNLGAEDSRLAFLALEQMVSKGKVSMEELRRQLGERLPGAMNIMATALGVGSGELEKMIRNGEVGSETIVQFAEQAAKLFEGGLAEAIKTPAAALTLLKNSVTELQLAFGDAFYEAMIPAIVDLTTALNDGDLKEQMKSVGTTMGNVASAMVSSLQFVVEHWNAFKVAIAGVAVVITGLGIAALVAAISTLSPVILIASGAITAAVAVWGAATIAANLLGKAIEWVATGLWNGIKAMLGYTQAQDQMKGKTEENTASVNKEAQAIATRNENLKHDTITLQQQVAQYTSRINLINKTIDGYATMTAAEKDLAGLNDKRIQNLVEESQVLNDVLVDKKADLAQTKQIKTAVQAELDIKRKSLVVSENAAEAARETAKAHGFSAEKIEEFATRAGDAALKAFKLAEEEKKVADEAKKIKDKGDPAVVTITKMGDEANTAAGKANKLATALFKAADAARELNDERGSGGSSGGGGGGSSSVNPRKQGGISHKRSGPVQTVKSSMFDGAPQFAEGGLTSGGFPAILHPNEAVIPLAGGAVPVELGTAGPAAASANGGQGMMINQKQFKAMQSSWSGMKTEMARVKEAINTASLVLRDGLKNVALSVDESKAVLWEILKDMQTTREMLLSKISSGGGGGGGSSFGGGGGGSSFGGGGEVSIQELADNVRATSSQIIQDSIRSAGTTSGGGYKINFNLKKSDELFQNEKALLDALLQNAVATGDLAKAERLRAAQAQHTQSANTKTFDLSSGFTTTGLGGQSSNVSFASGTSNTSKFMSGGQKELTATLHRDEMVLPADVSNQIRSGTGGNTGGGGNVIVQMTVNTPDASSFKESEDQIVQRLITKLDTVKRQNGTEHFNEDPTRKVRD